MVPRGGGTGGRGQRPVAPLQGPRKPRWEEGCQGPVRLPLPTPGTPPESETERWRVGEEEGHLQPLFAPESALPWEPQECPDNTVDWSSVQGIDLWRCQLGKQKHQDPKFAEKGPAGKWTSLR